MFEMSLLYALEALVEATLTFLDIFTNSLSGSKIWSVIMISRITHGGLLLNSSNSSNFLQLSVAGRTVISWRLGSVKYIGIMGTLFTGFQLTSWRDFVIAISIYSTYRVLWNYIFPDKVVEILGFKVWLFGLLIAFKVWQLPKAYDSLRTSCLLLFGKICLLLTTTFVPHKKPLARKLRRLTRQKSKRQKYTDNFFYVLPGTIFDTKVNALPDTGAELNIMSIALAKKLYLIVDNANTHSFLLPTGKTIQSLGTVSVLFRSKGETKAHLEEFDILPNPPHDVILGNHFLSRTETLTTNRRRLQRIPLIEPTKWSCCDMNGSQERLMGNLGGNLTMALPDTGCMVNLISLSYALKHGLQLSKSPEDRGYLRYADGSVEQTIGRVTLPWAFANQPDHSRTLHFEVVANCRYDVIIGQHTLLYEQAYIKHSSYFLKAPKDRFDDNESFELSPVGWTPNWVEKCRRKTKKPNAPSTQPSTKPPSLDDVALAAGSLQAFRDLRDLELERRVNADRLFEDMPEPGKSRAQEEEKQKRAAWDTRWNVVWSRRNDIQSRSSTNTSSLATGSLSVASAAGRSP